METKISFCTCVRNEARNLPELLEHVKDIVDEIIVIDDMSTDGTYEIAKRYGAKVYRRRTMGFVEQNRQYAFNKATSDWILYLEADERLSTELRRDLRKIIENSDEIDGYALSVRYYVKRGYFIKHYNQLYPNFRLRIFKKNKVMCKALIHTDPEVFGKIVHLHPDKYFIKHLVYEHYLLNRKSMRRHVKYAWIASHQRDMKWRGIIFTLSFPVTFPVRLLRELLIRKALLDGFSGVKVAFIYSIYLSLIDIFTALRWLKRTISLIIR